MPMHRALLLFSSADYAGKVDAQSLSEQTRMEVLFSGLDDKFDFCDADGEFKPIEAWEGVELGPDNSVRNISIKYTEQPWWGTQADQMRAPGGSIELQFIPENVTDFTLVAMQIHGTVETGVLPRNLMTFDISENNFTGTFDLCGLPQSLSKVNVDSNSLCGTLDLSGLPRSLERLSAGHNQFTGSIDVTQLREPIDTISLQNNQLSGTIDLSNMPPSLRHVSLDCNMLSQDVLTIGSAPGQQYCISVDTHAFPEVVHAQDMTMRLRKRGRQLRIQSLPNSRLRVMR